MPKSTCFSVYSARELQENLTTLASFRPTLGIVFSSIALDIPSVVASLQPENIPVFGCSTAGEILVTGEDDPLYDESAVCCFTDIDPTLFRVSLFDRGEDSCVALGVRIGAWGLEHFARPAFIIAAAGLKNDGEAIVRGIQQAAGSMVPLFGGMAGDDGRLEDTMVFSSERVSNDGAVVLVFDTEKVDVAGIASSGWSGIGIDMRITSSSGNTVYTINGRPAVGIFKEYLNVKDADLQQMGINFPLQVQRPDGTEVLRTFLSVNFAEGSLTFAGSIPEGSIVRFSSSFGYETIEETVRDITRFHDRHPAASLLLSFSCIARHRVAGPRAADEVRAASELWEAPLVGFFTYGEIGPGLSGTCDFYNETLSLVLISLRK